MSWAFFDRAGARLALALSVVTVIALGITFGTGLNKTSANTKEKSAVKSVKKANPANLGAGTTFPGTNVGAIPDNNTGNRDVSFDVNGLSGSITDVSADFTGTHSWVGDVDATLISPNGTQFFLFSFTGGTATSTFGDSSDLNGLYSFSDAAAGTNWWAAAFAAGSTAPIPPGAYRTTAAGPQPVNTTSPETNLTAAFASQADPNGTWILRFQDFANGDTGSVSAANLTLTTGSVAPSAAPNVDFDGDGKSDYAIVRNNTPPTAKAGDNPFAVDSYRERMKLMKPAAGGDSLGVVPGSSIGWYVSNSADSSFDINSFGEAATDFMVPADYDGDGKADVAVWRPVASSGPGGAFFFILNSSDSTVSTIDFGVQGDDPTVAGDYDGDGKADAAVYRCPSGATAGQCFFFYKGTAGGGSTTFVPWGFATTGSAFANPGDFDGDGKYDFSVQITNPAVTGGGLFVTLRSSDSGVNWVPFGFNTDVITPADYDGDGKTDYCVSRTVSGNRRYFAVSGADGATQLFYDRQFGLSGDFRVTGDYTGDGKADIAVFRPNADPDQNFFYVLDLTNSAVTAFEWGQNLDYPVGNWQVH
ncbi:MAG: VCBS repeat-containing protein [Pyrinomonadaceae bacterium]